MARPSTSHFFPTDGRLIRIRPTDQTRRLGIAGMEGYRQGDINEWAYWFAPADALPGDSKLGLPLEIPWWYIKED